MNAGENILTIDGYNENNGLVINDKNLTIAAFSGFAVIGKNHYILLCYNIDILPII